MRPPHLSPLALVLLSVSSMSTAEPSVDIRRKALAMFGERRLAGALVVKNVSTGKTLVTVDTGRADLGLPLSTAKLLIATIYFNREQELGPLIRPDIDLMIARGSDDAGRRLALDLRRTMGSRAVLADLALLGFPACSKRRVGDCTTLSSSTTDKDWADALSLGEADIRTTLEGLANFARMIGNGGRSGQRQVISNTASQRLRHAMLRTVELGTAKGSDRSLSGIGTMGGKTGSTSLGGAKPFDGMFAGLIFDREGRPRYAVATVVRRGGFGGGAAAEVTATIGAALLAGVPQTPPSVTMGSQSRRVNPSLSLASWKSVP